MSVERSTKRRMNFLSLVLVFVVILSAEAQAELFGFEAISDNSGESGTMAAQLSVDITDPGGDQVLFTFYNDGPLSSIYDVPFPLDGVVTEVYLEYFVDVGGAEGVLGGLAAIQDNPSEGVAFYSPTTGSFPEGGGLNPPFDVTYAYDFSAAAEPPPATWGVDPGESLGLLYDIESGKTFADVLAAINQGFENPLTEVSLRVALHVQKLGEDNEYSDGFILVPMPGAVILGMLGLCVAGLKLRRFA